MSEWKPITEHPEFSVGVELFYANLLQEDQDGNLCSQPFSPFRDFHRELGFWDSYRKEWCELGTGHSVFEDWRTPDQTPTHYRILPAPPKDYPMSHARYSINTDTVPLTWKEKLCVLTISFLIAGAIVVPVWYWLRGGE